MLRFLQRAEAMQSGVDPGGPRQVTTIDSREIVFLERPSFKFLDHTGFPTGRKWSFIPKESTKPKYLVVNADEGEPGTFKDRYILERDPHALLEGMIIAAYAIGSHKAYVYIRGEYFRPAKRLQRAIDEAYSQGWLGKNIQGTGFDLDVVIHRGAGAYICGEETALLTSLEGGKGFPRLKPPFPAISGLFQCPTIVNNVETLACVPFILRHGAERFAGIGTDNQGGTRLFCVSGHVVRPGVYEEPVGITLRQLIERAGGVRDGNKLKAVIPGGISAKILTADEIDVAMDFDSLMAAGTMAGSGGVIVMDETTCMVEALDSAAQVLRRRVLRAVLPLPRGDRLGPSHHAPHHRRAREHFRTWTTCSPSRATWKERPSASSRTRPPGRSSPTSRSSGTSSSSTSAPGRKRAGAEGGRGMPKPEHRRP